MVFCPEILSGAGSRTPAHMGSGRSHAALCERERVHPLRILRRYPMGPDYVFGSSFSAAELMQ